MKNSEQPVNAQSDLGHALIKEGKNNSRYGFGLTKREYFAGLAMQGLLSIYDKPNGLVPNDLNIKEMVILSVKASDALLEELEITK